MKSIYIYIHYPFCESKCPYCSFYSLFRNLKANSCYGLDDLKLFDIYKKHIDYYFKFTSDSVVKSIFFGGGTPSVASMDFLSKIIQYICDKWKIDVKDIPEISIEVNPSSVNESKFIDYKNIGFNRISVGVQSLNDDELKFLGRIHNSEQAVKVIDYATKYFDNVSADFIYGLPNHNLDLWEQNLNKILDLGLNHYSLYQLTIEDGTKFKNMVNNKVFDVIDENIEADLFLKTLDIMAGRLPYYEVSNFAKDGFECKHNLSYWTGKNYIGIGPSAESRVGLYSFRNDTNDYDNIICEKLSDYEKSEELILTSLRCKYGLDINILSVDILDYEAIDKLSDFVIFNKAKNRLFMTNKGLLYFNTIIEKIII